MMMKKWDNCGISLDVENTPLFVFCSIECSVQYNNKKIYLEKVEKNLTELSNHVLKKIDEDIKKIDEVSLKDE